MKKTLGGDRLGSGKNMQVHLHDYERSTHNLSKIIRTSMAAGVLTPVYRNYALNGDTWDINISHLIKTLPTKGPLMGSMKFQIDFFVCPLRLYVGLLHNNAVKIGMQMDKILFPKLGVQDTIGGNFSGSSICDYLGLRGMMWENEDKIVNAIPYLAYYDIFKNYYSNKQEEEAFVISGQYEKEVNNFSSIMRKAANEDSEAVTTITTLPYECYATFREALGLVNSASRITITNLKWKWIPRNETSSPRSGIISTTPLQSGEEFEGENYGPTVQAFFSKSFVTIIKIKGTGAGGHFELDASNAVVTLTTNTLFEKGPVLKSFPLENIDKMRYIILGQTELGDEFFVNQARLMPYEQIYAQAENGESMNHVGMNGLCVKTYQSDIYNAWLNSEWIDGKGVLGDGKSIQSISSVDVSNGQLTMDALNLAQKIYNMLNRVAASGGTYEDWQEAIYGEEAVRRAESPAYIGGASAEIIFDEVVSTAESGENPQGNLTGKGATTNSKGGHISIKITEPSVILGIASITPRIDYSQGNWWAGTELKTMDDLHKPALDGIGFQDLMAYNMGFWVDENQAVGKIPAWMHWMTDVNECFGDFSSGQPYDWMVLNRDYQANGNSIADITTYIDPSKYNGVFADARLSAQNYWVQLGFDIKCRRKMSAKLIPNL